MRKNEALEFIKSPINNARGWQSKMSPVIEQPRKNHSYFEGRIDGLLTAIVWIKEITIRSLPEQLRFKAQQLRNLANKFEELANMIDEIQDEK